MTAHRATGPDDLAALVAASTAAADGPVLIEAPITTVPPSL
ncbi:hypothetical protein ACFQ2B_28525 [Streptomyces stramineus]